MYRVVFAVLFFSSTIAISQIVESDTLVDYIKIKGDSAENVTRHLLDRYQTGLIATAEHDLRVAFSCLELEDIEPLFELIDRSVRDLA